MVLDSISISTIIFSVDIVGILQYYCDSRTRTGVRWSGFLVACATRRSQGRLVKDKGDSQKSKGTRRN